MPNQKKRNKKRKKKNKNEIKEDKKESFEEEIKEKEKKDDTEEVKKDFIVNSINRFKIHKIKFKYSYLLIDNLKNAINNVDFQNEYSNLM